MTPATMQSPDQGGQLRSFLLSLAQKAVLIADADTTQRRLAAAILSDAGCTVRTAPDADGVLDLVKIWCPRLLVLDLDLPGTGAHALTAMLRRRYSHLDAVPVVVVARPESHGLRRPKGGFSAIVPKPLHPETFVRQVEDLLVDPGSTP